MNISAKARVQITVEISDTQGWGGDCAIDQLYKQAAATALNILRNALKPEVHGVRIIGEPKIVGIITEEA